MTVLYLECARFIFRGSTNQVGRQARSSELVVGTSLMNGLCTEGQVIFIYDLSVSRSNIY